MIQARKIRLTLVRDPTGRDVGVLHPRGHADIGTTEQGHLPGDVGAPATRAAIVGHQLGGGTMTGTGTPIVNTAAAGPADDSVSERVPRRRPGHARRHAGAGRPPGGMSGEMETLGGADGMIIDGDETFWILVFCQCVRVTVGTMRRR